MLPSIWGLNSKKSSEKTGPRCFVWNLKLAVTQGSKFALMSAPAAAVDFSSAKMELKLANDCKMVDL